MFLFSAVLVCCVNSALSGITTTPGMQRRYQGQTATFQWSVTRPISSYSVNNHTLEYSGQLNDDANYIMDNRSGVVILIIKDVQLRDAGNYSLSVTTGATTQTDASALLFVYGGLTISVNQTSGGPEQQPATEGDAIELTCTAISTSVPWAYRPKIYYQWYLQAIGLFQNISSGQVTVSDYGDPVPGYSIRNDGRTLVIASAQFRDSQGILCYGQEQWSPYRQGSWVYLTINYRPSIAQQYSSGNKFTAIVGDPVSLSVSILAFPVAATSATEWSFIDTDGHAQDLPVGSMPSNSYSTYSLAFTLTSEAYYGNYSITLSNSLGSVTKTFQVLGLGPPDAPSSVMVNFVAHYLIAIAWNCMWSNGRQQTIFLQLRSMHNDSIIDSQNTTLYYTGCYNSTSITQFRNGIQAESDYEIRVWSTNNLGSSDVIRLTVKTPKIFTFNVSPKTISLIGNQAIVSYSATEGKIAQLDISYCVEFSGDCGWSYYYNLNDTTGRLNLDLTQSGDVYVFDFAVYGADSSRTLYYLAVVKGVRVSRNTEADESDGDKTNPLLSGVIVLAVLLGIAVLVLIGCIIAIIVFKSRQNTQSSTSQQPRTTRNTRDPQPTTQQTNQVYEEEDTYEAVEGNPSKNDDTHYTALEGQRYK